jgi:hypothetical protein
MGGELVSLDQVKTYSQQLQGQQRQLKAYDLYYDGEQPIRFISPEVRRLVGDRLTELVINWPQLVLDSIENRLDVDGFRLAGSDSVDDDLWSRWVGNGMDVDSQTAHLESMLYGWSAVSAWPEGNTGNDPVFALETPRETLLDFTPGTRVLRAAYKQWADGKGIDCRLYLPDRVEVYQGQSNQSVNNPDGTTSASMPYNVSSVVKQVDELPNPLGVVPFSPLVNRRRTAKLSGKSELDPILPLADAINKLATDLMVTSEFYAEPRRWATGIQLPAKGGEGADTVQRIQAEVRAYWDALEKGRTRLGGTGVTFGQDKPADLGQIVSAIEMLVQYLGALGVLPPHFLGISTANPSSADAIRSSEASLVKRAERKQRPLGGGWKTLQCYGQAIAEGIPVADLDPKYLRMETVWSSSETQTISQLGDFAQKMVDAEVMSVPTAQEWIGMTPEQQARDKKYRADAGPIADLEARLAFARELQKQDGVDPATAFAMAGLTAAQTATAAADAVVAPAATPPAA